jgi:hypothetical protein
MSGGGTLSPSGGARCVIFIDARHHFHIRYRSSPYTVDCRGANGTRMGNRRVMGGKNQCDPRRDQGGISQTDWRGDRPVDRAGV